MRREQPPRWCTAWSPALPPDPRPRWGRRGLGRGQRPRSKAGPGQCRGPYQTARACAHESSSNLLRLLSIRRTCQAVTPSRRATADAATVGRLQSSLTMAAEHDHRHTGPQDGCCHRRKEVFDPRHPVARAGERAEARAGGWAVDGAAAEGNRAAKSPGVTALRPAVPQTSAAGPGQLVATRPDSGPSDPGSATTGQSRAAAASWSGRTSADGRRRSRGCTGTPWDRSAVRTGAPATRAHSRRKRTHCGEPGAARRPLSATKG